jgi:alkanesulfonate monooxygenase SsuD/methylene tetrahydromethanopterin reductase-like flavin-dependent oxidoreductase (luciferase family)
LRLGMFSMPLHPPERPIADTYEDDFRTFELAEQLGYDEVWIGEHFTSVWENIPSPELFIAAAGARATKIRFGTGVLLMPFHNPVHTALRLAQLDHQLKGRLMVGVGSGGIAADKRAFGIDITPEEAGKLTREGTELLIKCWEAEPFNFEGQFFKTDVPDAEPAVQCGYMMKPYQRPTPPIAIAGVNKNSYGLGQAGERGWLALSTNFLPPDVLPSHWESYAAGAARVGRTPDRAAWRIARDVHVAGSSQEARTQALEGAMARAYSGYMLPLVQNGGRGLGAFKKDPEMPDAAVTPEYLLENVWIVGSVDEVVDQLGRLSEQCGGFGTLLQIAFDWAPDQAVWHRSMELLATKVMPQLRQA